MKKISVIGKWTVGSVQQGEEVEHWAEFCVFEGRHFDLILTKLGGPHLGKNIDNYGQGCVGTTHQKTRRHKPQDLNMHFFRYIRSYSKRFESTKVQVKLSARCTHLILPLEFLLVLAGRKWSLVNDSREEGEDLDLQPIEADRRRREEIVRDCGLDDLCCGVCLQLREHCRCSGCWETATRGARE